MMASTHEDAPLVPAWSIGVVTDEPDNYADLKNAFLYADHVYWVARDACFGRLAQFAKKLVSLAEPALRAQGLDPSSVFRNVNLSLFEEFLINQPASQSFEDDIDATGLRSVVSVTWSGEQVSEWLSYSWKLSAPESESSLRQEFAKAAQVLPETREGVWLNLFQRLLNIGLKEAMSGSTVFVNPGALQPPVWNAHARANLLMKALSRLMLPDLSALPLEAIAEVRDRLRDTLDPMRAEMLRLSENLRKVSADLGEDELLRESEELIATRVEPVVRMASARARDLAKKKWRKFFVGLARTFGFAGAGFLNPSLLTKALEEVLSTGAAISEMKETSEEPTKASATFVIEARRVIAERGA
jgi:hypothetical protein